MEFKSIVYAMASTAVVVAGVLFMANILLTIARLSHNKPFAEKIIRYLRPFAMLFRMSDDIPHIGRHGR